MKPATADEKLLDLIYGAAVTPALWAPAMEAFADALGGWGGSLLVQDQDTGAGRGLFTRADTGTAEVYFGYYANRNILMKTDDPRRFMREWTPSVLTDEDWVAKEALTGTEYYNDFLRPRDIHSVLFIRLAAQGMKAANFNVARPASRGQFGADDIAAARRWQPHLIRAFRLAQQVGEGSGLADGLAEALDRSPYGLFLVDADARVRRANRAGEALLRSSGGAIGARRGRLHGATPEATRRLQALARAAAGHEGGSLTLDAPHGPSRLLITVAPLRAEAAASLTFDDGPSVLVCVADLEAGVVAPAERLRTVFGLTRAEVRVAASLFEGRNTREAADHLGLSFFTVRAHLAHIFAKTGVSSQPDLARLMTRTAAVG